MAGCVFQIIGSLHLDYQIADDKESACSAEELVSTSGSGRFPRVGNGTPLQNSPGEAHGQRSFAGYSLWGHKELDMTGHTHTYPMVIIYSGKEFDKLSNNPKDHAPFYVSRT